MDHDNISARAAQDQEIAAIWNRWQQTDADIRYEIMDVINGSSAAAREAMAEWPNQWIDFVLCAAVIGLREMILQAGGESGED